MTNPVFSLMLIVLSLIAAKHQVSPRPLTSHTSLSLFSPIPLFSPFLFSAYLPPLPSLYFPTARFLFLLSIPPRSPLFHFSYSLSFVHSTVSSPLHVFLSLSSHLSVFPNCLLLLSCCLLLSSITFNRSSVFLLLTRFSITVR